MDLLNNRYVKFIVRYLLAGLFMFSGFVKCVDPMGSAIKFEEYFIAFSVDFLTPLAMVFAVVLSSVELLIGISILMGFYKSVVSKISLIFLSFFTLLTVVIYFGDPVSDCGCFGDAVTLSNGATLLKNCLFLILGVILWMQYRREPNDLNDFIGVFVFATFSFAIPIYSAINLPILDFLPYKVGADINKINNPEGVEDSTFETKLKYRNIESGKEKIFSVEDTEWQDESKWEFVDVIAEGADVNKRVFSFDIVNEYGDVVSDEVLSEKGLRLFVISNDINDLLVGEKLAEVVNSVEEFSIPLYIFTSTPISESRQILSGYNIDDKRIYNLDETTIKTVIRAKAGVVLVDEGVIIAKHNFYTMVIVDSIEELEEYVESQKNSTKNSLIILGVLFVTIIFMSKINYMLFKEDIKATGKRGK